MDEQNTTNTPAPDTTPVVDVPAIEAAPKTPFYTNKLLIASIVVALAILGGAGYYVYSTQYAHGGVVAVVNGEKIYRDALDENMKRMQDAAVAQGFDVTDPEVQKNIQTQSLQILIDNAVLKQDAAARGITATEEEVTTEYNKLLGQAGGEEGLQALLTETKLSKEELMKNIREYALIQNYFEDVSDIENVTVSEEEITTALTGYDPAKHPPLEEVRAQIQSEILRQKQEQIAAEILTKLKEGATIEEKI